MDYFPSHNNTWNFPVIKTYQHTFVFWKNVRHENRFFQREKIIVFWHNDNFIFVLASIYFCNIVLPGISKLWSSEHTRREKLDYQVNSTFSYKLTNHWFQQSSTTCHHWIVANLSTQRKAHITIGWMYSTFFFQDFFIFCHFLSFN